jgi:hypothetical protein
MSRFSWLGIIAAELLAITQVFKFDVDEAYLKEQSYPKATLS